MFWTIILPTNKRTKKTNPKLLAGILKEFSHFLLKQILGMAKIVMFWQKVMNGKIVLAGT